VRLAGDRAGLQVAAFVTVDRLHLAGIAGGEDFVGVVEFFGLHPALLDLDAGVAQQLDGAKARVTREVDAGLETIEVDLPAVITSDLRLNEPRYVKLPDIMKAKKKQLDTIAIADLGVDAGAQFKTLNYAPPASRQKGIMVKDVAGLVEALKQKGLL